MKRGELATAHKGSHDFAEGEELRFIGMDFGADYMEAHVFVNKNGIVNWLVDGDFSWKN